MLVKHSFLYALARGIPGLVNFAALAVYTRLLSPDEYGQYALVIAVVGFLNMVLFEWLHLGLLRYLASAAESKPVFLSTIIAGFIALALIVSLSGAVFYVCYPQTGLRELILPGLVLLFFTGLFNLNLQLKTAQLLPLQFGQLSAGKSVFGLMFGATLVWFGYGPRGILLALALAMGLSLLLWARREWRDTRLALFDKSLMRRLMGYGLPLAANLAMAEVISSSDRMFLVWMHDEATTGLYAVGYDFASHVLGVLLMIINLAAYPLAVRALEQQGKAAAVQQLRKNVILLSGVAVPAAIGLAVLAPGISRLFLGEAFRQAAQAIIPWVALAALLAGLKAYYFDLAFQLGQHTLGQLYVLGAAALINLLLNRLLIPDLAVMGAIYATLAAYCIGLLLSVVIGRRWFKLPFPAIELLKITAAGAMMGVAVWPWRDEPGPMSLAMTILLGAAVYCLLLALFNTGGLRDNLINITKQRRQHD